MSPTKEELRKEYLEKFEEQRANPASRHFSDGQMNLFDEGDLYFKIGVLEHEKQVVIEFSHPAHWISFNANEAEEVVKLLQKHIKTLRSLE